MRHQVLGAAWSPLKLTLPGEPWCGLCALCNVKSPSAHLVRAPGGSWRKLGTAWWVPPQWSESGCVAWVLFSIRWGPERFRFIIYYSDDMFTL